jgi:hypothetical protein
VETKPIALITNHRVARVILCAALFTIAFSVRWYGIEEAGNQNDEHVWYYRAAHLMNDILRPFEITNIKLPFEAYDIPWVRTGEGKPYPFDINQRARHPGTPPSLLMGLSYFLLAENTNDASLDLLPLRSAMRLPQVLLGSLLAVFLFFLGRRLWGDHIALLAACIYLLEPYTIGHSRLARIDVSESFFILLTILTYTIGRLENRDRMRMLSGIFLGVGLAHRPYSILVVPILLSWVIISSHGTVAIHRIGRMQWSKKLLSVLIPKGKPALLLLPALILSSWAVADILWLKQVSLPLTIQTLSDAYHGHSIIPSLNEFFGAKTASQTLKPLQHYTEKLVNRWDRYAPTLASVAIVGLILAYITANLRGIARFLKRYTDRYDGKALGLAFLTFLVFFPNFWANPVLGVVKHAGLIASLPHVTGESSALMPTSPLIYWVYWALHLSPLLTVTFLFGVAIVVVRLWSHISIEKRSGLWTQKDINLLLCALWVIAIMGLLGLPSGRKSYKNLNFVIPAICVLSAFGIASLYQTIEAKWRRQTAVVFFLLIGFVFAAQNAYLLQRWFPYYQLYTLEITGDPQLWDRRELLAGGEGLKEVAEYLASTGHEGDVVACATGHNNLCYFHAGKVLDHSSESIRQADWLIASPKITYAIPRNHELVQHISSLEPPRVFYHNQIELARLYRLHPEQAIIQGQRKANASQSDANREQTVADKTR